MKCEALLSNKLRCKNKGSITPAKIELKDGEILREIHLCEVHEALVKLSQEVQKLTEQIKK